MNGSFGVNVAGGFDGIVLKPTASDGLKRMIQSAVCTTARPVDEMSIDVTLSDLAAGRVATTTVAAQLLDLLDSSLGVDSVHHWRAVAKSAIDIFVDLISYSSRDVVAASSRAASWRANKSFHGLERASSGGVGLPFQLPSLNRIHSFESIDGDTSARGAADHDDSHLSMVLPDIQVTSDDAAGQTPPMAATPVAHANRATIGDEEVDGTFTINQHLILMPIGRGSQGEVFLAMDTTRNKLRAIKAIRRPKGVRLTDGKSFDPCSEGLRGGALAAARHQRRVLLEKEVAIMKRCRHRHLVALYEVIDDPELDVMYLVMQYVENGPLARIATDGTVQKTIPPNKLADYALQIVSGLKYLHSKGVIHRDIKPDNILLGAHDDVYLADFGTSELFDCNSANIRVRGTRGTLAFMAPELFAVNSGEERSHGGPGVDVWALGVTLYTLLYGKLPWAATTSVNLCEEIMSASVVMPPTKDSPILFDSSSDTPSRHTKTCLPSPLAATDPLPEFFDVSLCSPESALNTPRCPNIGSPAIAASSINGSNFLRRRLGRRTLDEMWATLLAGMLHRDPEQRFKLDEITQHLNAIKSSSFDALDSMMMASFAELAVEPISVVRRVSVAPTA